MAALPRGVCAFCGMTVPLRRNGVTREHRYQGGRGMDICKGAGKPPRDSAPFADLDLSKPRNARALDRWRKS